MSVERILDTQTRDEITHSNMVADHFHLRNRDLFSVLKMKEINFFTKRTFQFVD